MAWVIRVLHGFWFALCGILFISILGGSSLLVSADPNEIARRYTRSEEFEFVNWTLDALGLKLGQAALETPFYFDPSSRQQVVTDYFSLLDDILQNEGRLALIYADPTVADPASASASLREELVRLYARQRQIGPLAESIFQEQISATLAGLGLTSGGQPVPPVLFHMTPLPYNLVISPRDKIVEEAVVSLEPTLTVDEQVAIEEEVTKGMDVSALVVPVGGIGTYPTMVERTTALEWLSSTIAHEWTHNWLTLRPLGLNYGSSAELRTMNETTADIVGDEVGLAMLSHYYPQLPTRDTTQVISLSLGPAKADFDFRTEMHATRVRVDDLLAQGKIDEAESYMEQRRQVFWDNGYPIRKLNQAYFAFYGAYAATPGGAAGEDPVGPAVRALRAQSSSLAGFLHKISGMTSFAQLQAAVSP